MAGFDPNALADQLAAQGDQGYTSAQAPTPRRGLLGQAIDALSEAWHESTDGITGFSAETNHQLGRDIQMNPVRPLTELLYGTAEGAYVGAQYLWGGIETLARSADAASRASGLADALSFDGNKFLPGSAVMALAEAFPMAGGEAGLAAHAEQGATAAARRLKGEASAARMERDAAAALRERGAEQKLEPSVKPQAPQESLKAEPPVPEPSNPAAGAVLEPKTVDELAPTPKVAAQDNGLKPVSISEKLDDGPVGTPEGPLLSSEELLGDPKKAAQLVEERLGKLTPKQAGEMLGRIELAMKAGTVVDDPAFKSWLNVKLDKLPQEDVMRVLQVFDDSLSAMAEKAGAGTRTINSMKAEFYKLRARGVTLEDLAKNAEDTHGLAAKARLGVHAMVKAGYDFVVARNELLPKVLRGEPGAREALVDQLVRSSQIYALGKAPLSNSARAMRFAQEDIGLGISKIADDVVDLPDPKMVEKRVRDAMRHLSDDDLAELAGHIKTAKDLDRVSDVLNDAEAAQKYSLWRRALASVSKALRSNALSHATGVFNAASFVIHDVFRSDLSRTVAIRRAIREGRLNDAELFRLEKEAGRAVYWAAHMEGLKAMGSRLKWEALLDGENIARLSGFTNLADKAREARAGMLDRGYSVPSMREYQRTPALAFTAEEARNFDTSLKARALSGGSLIALLNATQRVGATAVNVLDALSGASMKVFINSIDDAGRAFVAVKEMHTQATRFAFREGVAQGLEGKALASFVKQRAGELVKMPSKNLMDAIEEALFNEGEVSAETKYLLQRDRLVDDEVDKVMFMDGPQTEPAKASARFLGIDRLGVVFPFIKTPIRLFETAVVDYTPWAGRADHIRKVLEAGGPEAQLIKARMDMFLPAVSVGIGLGLSGIFVATNGGFENTAGLDTGPPNRVQIGKAYFETSRFDPFSITLAIGGLIGQAIREGFKDGTEYDVMEGLKGAMATAYMGLEDSILSKSYLKGLRDAVEAATSSDGDRAMGAVGKLFKNSAARMVPLAGVSRNLTESLRPDAVEAITTADQVLRGIPGASLYAPVRRDILGNPVDGRLLGTAVGSSSPHDDVAATLQDLGLDIQALRRTDPSGVKLTAKQLDELRYIRGHEAVNADGLTLPDALRELFAQPYFKTAATKDIRASLVSHVISSFNQPARDILAQRDVQYDADRQANKAFRDYLKQGYSKSMSEAQAAALASDLGLPPPNLQ